MLWLQPQCRRGIIKLATFLQLRVWHRKGNSMRFLLSGILSVLICVNSSALQLANYVTPQQLNAALYAVQAGQQRCKDLGVACSIVIADRYGVPIVLTKMAQALPQTVSNSRSKAFTASTLGESTDNLRKNAYPGEPYYGLSNFHYWGQQALLFPGGKPIKIKGILIGGVGVGSTKVSADTKIWIHKDDVVASLVVKAFEHALVADQKNPKSPLTLLTDKNKMDSNAVIILALKAGVHKCRQEKHYCSIALVDTHGLPFAVARMDGTLPATLPFALSKAYTAGTIGASTRALQADADPKGPYYGLDNYMAFGDKVWTTMVGGQPITLNKTLIGGVGVAATTDQQSPSKYLNVDDEVGQAVISVLDTHAKLLSAKAV